MAPKVALRDDERRSFPPEFYKDPKTVVHKTWTMTDLRMALNITSDELETIRKSCISIITGYVDCPDDEFIIRREWNGENGKDTKMAMIRDLIQAERSFLDAGSQFSTKPQHWDDSKQRIAEELLIWANTARTRRLKKPEKNNNPPSSSHHRARRQSSAPSQPGSVRQSSITSSLHNHLAEVSFADINASPPATIDTITNRMLQFQYGTLTENINIGSARDSDQPSNSPLNITDLRYDSFRSAVRDMLDDVEDIDIWALNLLGELPLFRKVNNDTRLHAAVTKYFTTPSTQLPPGTSFFLVQDAGEPEPQGTDIQFGLVYYLSHANLTRSYQKASRRSNTRVETTCTHAPYLAGRGIDGTSKIAESRTEWAINSRTEWVINSRAKSSIKFRTRSSALTS
jgi:hypothetical protein